MNNEGYPDWGAMCTLTLSNKFQFEAEVAANVVKSLTNKYQYERPEWFEEFSKAVICVSTPLMATHRIFCEYRNVPQEEMFSYQNTLRFFRHMQFSREQVLGERR